MQRLETRCFPGLVGSPTAVSVSLAVPTATRVPMIATAMAMSLPMTRTLP